MGLGTYLMPLAFATYLAVVGTNIFHLFAPSTCGAGTPRQLCVPPALSSGEKFDLWVYASPEKHFHAVAKRVTAADAEVRGVWGLPFPSKHIGAFADAERRRALGSAPSLYIVPRGATSGPLYSVTRDLRQPSLPFW
jgi:hypothetical protein